MGDSLIMNYTVVAVTPGNSLNDTNNLRTTGDSSPLNLTGIVDGVQYDVFVFAQNGAGYSEPSRRTSFMADTLPVSLGLGIW